MNKGIEILLARMESNPDEFMGINNKWSNLIESNEEYMTDEDRKALFGKLHELRMDKFTEHVMKRLLAEQEEKNEEFGQYASAAQARAQAQNMAAQQQYYINAQNQALTGLTSMALGSVTAPSYEIQGANQVSTQVRVGKQTLTDKTLKKLKALVK